MHTSHLPLVVVLGPTTSGKTAYSLRLAAEVRQPLLRKQYEIINADSRQLYKYLDIGTAKITKAEMQGVPHHLIDALDPKEEATAAWFQKQATRVIAEIHGRGNVPMLVGGSMLYISAVIDGLEFPEESDPALRKRLSDEYDEDGGKTLYTKLQEIDPETAAAFSVKNKPYVIRAMEIYETTRRSPSRLRTRKACPYDLHIFGMRWPREELNRRIDVRTEELFKKGWVEEVRSLLDRGYGPEDPGMKSVGYREIMEYIKAVMLSSAKHENPDVGLRRAQGDIMKNISAKTRQYAKRQMTWWKRDSRIEWLDQRGNR